MVAIKRHDSLRIEVVAIESPSFAWVSMELPLLPKDLCISITQDVAGCLCGRDEKEMRAIDRYSRGKAMMKECTIKMHKLIL
jgi:hypothetical protein